MNNKGFTLVELLVTLVLLGIIATISITGVVSVMNNSKNSEYKVLLKNIDTGSKMFYEDCEYGSLRGKKLSTGDFVCKKMVINMKYQFQHLYNMVFLREIVMVVFLIQKIIRI